jgi:hypothetical protein
MEILKKILLFIKTYWIVCLIILAMIPFIFFMREKDFTKLAEYLAKKNVLFQKEIDIIDKNKEDKVIKIAQAEKRFEDAKQELEEKYNKRFEELNLRNAVAVEKIKKELELSPEEYVKNLAKENGWKFIE